jgi:hypothetical protein
MDNPYQTPSAAVADRTLPAPQPRGRRAWIAYLVLVLAICGFGAVLALRSLAWFPASALAMIAPAWILAAWSIIGLWSYIRQRPVGARWVWEACLLLNVVHMLTTVYIAVRFVRPNGALSMLTGLPLMFPLLVALWLYAFRSAHIWKR